MAILNIQPVSRAGMRLLISLYGLSETGKTYSALRLAAGIEPDPTRRMLLDTEGGQRGRAYVDAIQGGYMYAALSPPFTPERYIEAINEIEAAGIRVLVTDSASHAWFAEGGILDMVEVANEKNDMAKWAKPKRRLSKLTRRWLSSDMHIILCSRAKQPLIEEIVDGRKKLTPGPVVPVQEKSLRYDMTIMAHMLGDGRFTVSAPAGKCPGALRSVFASGEVMDEAMGRKLIAWIGAETSKTPAQRALERQAVEAAEMGSDDFRAFWKGLTADQREALRGGLDNYQSIAKSADREAEERQQAVSTAAADEDPFPPHSPGSPISIAPAQPLGSRLTDRDPAFWDEPDYGITRTGDIARDTDKLVERVLVAPNEDALEKLKTDNAALIRIVKDNPDEGPTLSEALARRSSELARMVA